MKRLRLWYKFEGKYMFKNFKQGIKNLINYFSIIWKDRDWDYRYTLNILEYKLKRQRNHIEKNKRFIGYEFVVRDIDICLNLLDKFKEDYYNLEMYDYLDQTHEFIPTDKTNKWFTLEFKTQRNDLQKYFEKYPKIYEKYKHLKDDKKIAHKMGDHLNNKCKKLFFKILEEKILSWWD